MCAAPINSKRYCPHCALFNHTQKLMQVNTQPPSPTILHVLCHCQSTLWDKISDNVLSPFIQKKKKNASRCKNTYTKKTNQNNANALSAAPVNLRHKSPTYPLPLTHTKKHMHSYSNTPCAMSVKFERNVHPSPHLYTVCKHAQAHKVL